MLYQAVIHHVSIQLAGNSSIGKGKTPEFAMKQAIGHSRSLELTNSNVFRQPGSGVIFYYDGTIKGLIEVIGAVMQVAQ